MMRKLLFLRKNKESNNTDGLLISNKDIRLIVGLGNPGKDYENTYHNAGFMFIDSLVSKTGSDNPEESQSWQSEKLFKYIKINGVVLAKPNTFMNESGRALKEMIKKFRISTEQILIAHDDADIEIGKYKIVFDRGSAGHNGVISINNHLKTTSLLRLRIGIRSKKGKASKFVLQKICSKEKEILEELFQEVQAQHIKL